MDDPTAVDTGEIHALKETPEIVYIDIVIKSIDLNITFLQLIGGTMRTMKFTRSSIQHEKSYDLRMLFFINKIAAGSPPPASDHVQMNKNLHSIVDGVGANLLHYSAKKGNALSTQWLLDQGFEVDAKTKYGETPLMLAVRERNEDTVCVLLKANAKIDLVDNLGKTMLQKVGAGSTPSDPIPGALLMKLLDKCDTVEEAAVKLLDVQCPLWLALHMKNSEVLKFVLDRGVDVDVRDPRFNFSALHLAVQFHDLKGVKLLLNYGADVNAKWGVDFTPIWHLRPSEFCKDEQVGILKLLLDRGAEMTSRNGFCMQIETLLLFGSEEAVRLVLQTNIDLYARNGLDETLLHCLARNVNLGNLEVLQDRILDVNARNSNGSTALHGAAVSGQSGAVQFLLDRGADFNIQDKQGKTPLYYAVTCKNMKGIELLLQRGAEVRNEIFEVLLSYRNCFDSSQPILAYLAILEATGTVVKTKISTMINSDLRFQTSFNSYKQQLEQLKEIVICDSVTAFTLLTETESKLLARLRNRRLLPKLKFVDYKNTAATYYYEKLQEQIETTLRKIQLRERVAAILYEMMNILYCSYPTITDQIISYLGESDLQRLSRI